MMTTKRTNSIQLLSSKHTMVTKLWNDQINNFGTCKVVFSLVMPPCMFITTEYKIIFCYHWLLLGVESVIIDFFYVCSFFCMRFKIEVMTHNMSFCMTIIRLGHFAILSMNKVSYWWVWCLLILCTHLHAQAHTVTHIFIYTCEKNHCVIELHVHVCRSRLHVGKRKKCIWCVTYMYRAYCTCMYCRNTPYVHMLVLQ